MSAAYGLDVPDLREGWTPLEAIVVLKCLAEDGTVGHSVRWTTGLNQIEALGMLTAASGMTEQDVLASFGYREEPEDDD